MIDESYLVSNSLLTATRKWGGKSIYRPYWTLARGEFGGYRYVVPMGLKEKFKNE